MSEIKYQPSRPDAVSTELEHWLERAEDTTLAGLIAVFGLLVVGRSVAAFVAPPFTGLDTLPALGVVLLSLGVLLEDMAIVIRGVIVALVRVVLEVILGAAAIKGISSLLQPGRWASAIAPSTPARSPSAGATRKASMRSASRGVSR